MGTEADRDVGVLGLLLTLVLCLLFPITHLNYAAYLFSRCAQALQCKIRVYSVGLPPVCMGGEGAADGTSEALQLCYLRHAFGLGEHYNSVVALAAEQSA